MIALLVGQIFHATVNRIAKVEDDYHDMMELKKRAEAADIAKSQVHFTFSLSAKMSPHIENLLIKCLMLHATCCSFLPPFLMRSGLP